MNILAVGLYVFMSLVFGTAFVECDCIVHAKEGSKSQFHLDRLDPLKGKTFEFKYKDEKDQDVYLYRFSICKEVTEGSNAGVTQHDLRTPDKSPVIVGRINDTVVKSGTDWIMLTYKSGKAYNHHCESALRQAHIMILCKENTLADNFAVIYEENLSKKADDCYYLMEMESSVACSSSSADQGLSTGSVILIILACLTATYLGVGMIYKRCVHGAKGVEQVPNIAFWRMCGNLQADGCELLCRCQESGFDSSRPYRGIADDQLDDEADDENLLPM